MKILINLNTIKENPKAGATLTYLNANWECSFKSNFEFPKDLVKEEDEYSITHTESVWDGIGSPKIVRMDGYIHNPVASQKIFDWYLKNKKDGMELVITESKKRIPFHHSPIEKYEFEYDDEQEVECPYCKKSFEIQSVKVVDNRNEDGDEYCINCCPHCSEGLDDDYEYETIEEALQRKQSLEEYYETK